MSSRYGILCILLFFIVLILGYENYEIWSSPSAMTPKRDTGKKGETKPDPPTPATALKEAAPREAFNAIAEKNVFNPERKEFSTMEAAAMAKPVTRPQSTLYGVVIAEDYQTASVVNPGRILHKGERETKTLKIGDMVGEYKLTKIMQDRIVMEAGEDSFEVLLYDPRTPKKRVEVKTPTQPTTVTSTVPAPTSPGGAQPPPPAVVSPPAPVTPASPTPRPVTPVPVPRTPGSAPEGVYQSPVPPVATTPPAVADPGVWRGRRPMAPAAPAPAGPSG
jgi:hypothetical protein